MASYQQLPTADRSSYVDVSTTRHEDPEHDHLFEASRSLTHESSEKALGQRRRYIYSGLALLVCLITFVVQTEVAGYLATTLQYKKPIFMLYITHSSWTLLWPLQILILRLVKYHLPFSTFFRLHLKTVLSTAEMILDHNTGDHLSRSHHHTPQQFTPENTLPRAKALLSQILKICFYLFLALTVAGSSWYIAINLTTTSDITAIYNCSAFFAYAFSVPLLHEPLRRDKAFSVILAMVGVFIVAYGGGTDQNEDDAAKYPFRVWGNLIIGVGAVLYGLYEVLYKKLACPPSAVSPRRQAVFANVVGSGIGLCTLCVLLIALPILHWTGVERFELPRGQILGLLCASIVSNMLFSGGMLVLMSLTSPVLSSVASLLTIFIVAIVDWFLFSVPVTLAGLIGGIMIIAAFLLLSYATWLELQAEDDTELEDEYNQEVN
ncbi:uncharacterized protein SAPINGB_P002628 [Magnusiomyces paraingens]|uniref:Uncharacterized protein n=1 Tax=Magnusiomyces paraingens TaxID=2606893 RepID=A0A5E8BEX0_9ASCO|nr:uncharacterized protein SAPINGB_P002628 [Saprochaete ingens]VVT50155.1 unnamed protein product [Saprochaete ingens]